MKVLVFAEYGWRNGGENSWLAVAENLRNQGIEFTVACPPDTEFSRHIERLSIPSLPWILTDQTGKRKTQELIRNDIETLIEMAQPDLVHANSLSSCRLVGPVTQKRGVPSLGYLRDIIKVSRQAMADINCIETVVAVSAATRNYHLNHGLNPNRSVYIHNGVDLEQFKPRFKECSIHGELGLPNLTRLVLCVGQIGMRKGTDDVIDAFLNLNQKFNNLALLIVGMRNSVKDEAVEFEKQCREKSNDFSNIHWLGRRMDMAELMNDAHLLMHGARQEPLGRVLLESLAAGLPFVATDVGGTREIIDNCDLQQLVLANVNDPANLAAKAGAILADRNIHAQIAGDFRQRAIDHFDVDRCGMELLSQYQKLFSNSK